MNYTCQTNSTFLEIAKRRKKKQDPTYCLPTSITINYISPNGAFKYTTLVLDHGYLSPYNIKQLLSQVLDDSNVPLAESISKYTDFLNAKDEKLEKALNISNFILEDDDQ